MLHSCLLIIFCKQSFRKNILKRFNILMTKWQLIWHVVYILGVFGNINWLLIQKYGTMKPTGLILRNSKIFKPYYFIIRQRRKTPTQELYHTGKHRVGLFEHFSFYFILTVIFLHWTHGIQGYNFNKLILCYYDTHLYKYRQYYGHISQFINRIFTIVNNSLTILLSLQKNIFYSRFSSSAK